jgi:hypothetical protein
LGVWKGVFTVLAEEMVFGDLFVGLVFGVGYGF